MLLGPVFVLWSRNVETFVLCRVLLLKEHVHPHGSKCLPLFFKKGSIVPPSADSQMKMAFYLDHSFSGFPNKHHSALKSIRTPLTFILASRTSSCSHFLRNNFQILFKNSTNSTFQLFTLMCWVYFVYAVHEACDLLSQESPTLYM